MEKINKVEVDGEDVYIKKSVLGTRVVYPVKIDGKINWKNLFYGSIGNLIALIVYIAIALLIYYGMKDIIGQCQEVVLNPCKYCHNLIKIP